MRGGLLAATLLLGGCFSDATSESGTATGTTAGTGSTSTGTSTSTSATSQGSTAADTGATTNPSGPFKVRVDLDVATLTAPVADVPVVVRIPAGSPIYDGADPSGSDIRFFDEAELDRLAFEIEDYRPDAETLIWVNVPMAGPDPGTDHFWLYYGDPEPTEPLPPTDTWLSFAAVWHMHRLPTQPLVDATINGHAAAPAGGIGADALVTGQIGSGIAFSGTDWVAAPSAAVLEASTVLTLEAWVSLSSLDQSADRRLIAKNGAYSLTAIDDVDGLPRAVIFPTGMGTPQATAGNAVLGQGWTYVVGTYDSASGDLALHINGALNNLRTITPVQIRTNNEAVRLGDGLIGVLDEVRISQSVRPAAWIDLQYRSMTGSLVTIGPPEPR